MAFRARKVFGTFEKRAPVLESLENKPFVKLRSVHSVKLIFSHIVKGIKIKTPAKFRASRRFRLEDKKRIVTRKAPEKFWDIQGSNCRTPGPHCFTQAAFFEERVRKQ